MVITLNGDRFEIDEPLSVTALLQKLEIDPRRVAIEHNLAIIKRHRYPEVVVVDPNPAKVNLLIRAESPDVETGLVELIGIAVEAGRLRPPPERDR